MIRSVFIALGGLAALAACAAPSPGGGALPVALSADPLPDDLLADDPLAEDPWFALGRRTLAERKAARAIRGPARNVILFVADGMDPTTAAAARIFDGQTRGGTGEENLLSFERFPHVAMSKTYTTDHQVPDSAGTMSAMVTGVKTKSGVLSLTDAATRGDCASARGALAPTLGEYAKQAGLALGIVTTTALTHATPGAVYAHTPERGWGADADMPDAAKAQGCIDIARQLIEFPYGDGLDIALGGGRAHFLPETMEDPEDAGETGERRDGRDLAAEWAAKSSEHVFVWNRAQFDAAPANAKILGLFERGHLEFEADRAGDAGGEPSLTEMTVKAIEHLARGDKGFFLMVEAGRVDHAHHGGNAYRALVDTQEFAEAVAAARAMTRVEETLIIATADHGHTMAFQGYPKRGSSILGLVGYDAADGKGYSTLAYANGPGSVFAGGELPEGRPAPDPDEAKRPDYRQQALIPLRSETHGGQDVTIHASGPGAYLFDGVVEQNYVFHVIDEALRLRARAAARADKKD